MQRMQDWVMANGSSLRRYRKGAGLTQQELAERAGVSLRMVRAYEQGTQDIAKAEVASIQRLSQALHCQVSDLVGG
ncbi:MAG: helix-turn-helix transcriptional regulator [Bacteroidales bacterium]|nr:helix-turn-helix transcriptional regulator [Bacteroidales bacterium]